MSKDFLFTWYIVYQGQGLNIELHIFLLTCIRYVKLVTSQANLAFTLVSTHTGLVTLNKAVGHSLTEPSVDLCLYICVPTRYGHCEDKGRHVYNTFSPLFDTD